MALSASAAPAGVPTLQITTVDPKKDDVPARHLWFSLLGGVAVGLVIVLLTSTTPSKTVGIGIVLLGAVFAWANPASDAAPWLGSRKASVWITGIT